MQRSQARLATVCCFPVRTDERDRGVPQRDAPASRGRHERRQRRGRRILGPERPGRDVHGQPIEDAPPSARGPRRTIAGQVPFDVNPAASGPRRLNPRRSHDRAAAPRQSEEHLERAGWLRVLICRLRDEVRRSRGQHAF